MTAQPKRKHVAKYGLRRKSAKFMRAGQRARLRIEEIGYPATQEMTLRMMAREIR